MIDLGSISRIVDRPGATPAPTTPQPTPPPPLPPASPWQPRVTDEDTYRAFLDGLTTGDLIAEIRRGGDELAAGIARNRQLGEVK
ncbi:hypothetical protein ACQP2C_00010 [Micromonospora zamorensis]|uniref:hypothetical protein n=1 Tax=Micromonospora zamorensis TaxID=709883 RepID=UPI003D966CD0